MRTAVDSSILLDVLGADATFGHLSREALRTAYDSGALVACDVVWAEVRAHFEVDESFRQALDLLGVRYDTITSEAARVAGRLWREHRARGAPHRQRLVPDFLMVLTRASSQTPCSRGTVVSIDGTSPSCSLSTPCGGDAVPARLRCGVHG